MGTRSRDGHPAIDRKGSTCNPGCFVGCQIEDHMGHLFWFSGSADRIVRENGVQLFWVAHQRSSHWRIDESWIDHVTANALLGVINRKGSGHGIERPLRGGIDR